MLVRPRVALASAAVAMAAACSVALDFDGFTGKTLTTNTTASSGGAPGTGGSGSTGGESPSCPPPEVLPIPAEGAYTIQTEDCDCTDPLSNGIYDLSAPERCVGGDLCSNSHGLEVHLVNESNGQVFITDYLGRAQSNVARVVVEQVAPLGSSYEGCWSYTTELAGLAGDPVWQFTLWLCTSADGSVWKVFERNYQQWNYQEPGTLSPDEEANTYIHCGDECASPVPLIKPLCTETCTEGCMRVGDSWDLAGCNGYNAQAGGSFKVGGRMTWLSDDEVTVGSRTIVAHHLQEEQIIENQSNAGMHGTLVDPRSDLPDLGQIIDWWIEPATGLIVRYNRKIRVETPFRITTPIASPGCARYWERGYFGLTVTTPQPVADDGGGGGGADPGAGCWEDDDFSDCAGCELVPSVEENWCDGIP